MSGAKPTAFSPLSEAEGGFPVPCTTIDAHTRARCLLAYGHDSPHVWDLGQPVDKVERPRETEPRPHHYNSHPSGVECWTIVEHFSFAVGNAVKYCWRAGLKSPDPIADLRKAKHCLEREIARLERERDRGVSK